MWWEPRVGEGAERGEKTPLLSSAKIARCWQEPHNGGFQIEGMTGYQLARTAQKEETCWRRLCYETRWNPSGGGRKKKKKGHASYGLRNGNLSSHVRDGQKCWESVYPPRKTGVIHCSIAGTHNDALARQCLGGLHLQGRASN